MKEKTHSLENVFCKLSMKKLMRSLVIMAVFLALSVSADSRTIKNVTLNGVSSVTVPPGATINVSVTVQVTGTPVTPWGSTRYIIEGGSWKCNNTPDHTSAGTYTESFIITAPSSVGMYDFNVTAHGGPGNINNCDTQYTSNMFTLTNGIVVQSTQPVCGDQTCNGEETCSTCPRDCGECPSAAEFPSIAVPLLIAGGAVAVVYSLRKRS